MSDWREVTLALDTLPLRAPPLPGRYALRLYRAGDEASWLRIHEAVGIYGSVSPALFQREFGDRLDALPDRQFFVTDDEGEAVATGTAWFPHGDHPPTEGRIHWIAVAPAHQRRGIASALVRILLARMHALGHDAAYLTTGSDNHPALALYGGLGFTRAS